MTEKNARGVVQLNGFTPGKTVDLDRPETAPEPGFTAGDAAYWTTVSALGSSGKLHSVDPTVGKAASVGSYGPVVVDAGAELGAQARSITGGMRWKCL